MTVSINSNSAALRSQRYLSRGTGDLLRSSERLASGQRINRASDDAAGLAISSSLRSDARVFGQAIRNLNDGLSALAIAEGAARELSSIVTRIRELATQSATETFSGQQRKALNREALAIREEYNRIVSTTTFNGIRLIDGRTGNLRLSAGSTRNDAALWIDSTNLGTGRRNNGGFESDRVNVAAPGLTSANAVDTGDVNEDGVLDLVAVAGSSISVMLGNGDGTYRAARTYGSGYGTVVVGDVNGDGLADVVSAGGGSTSVLLANSDGSLRAAQQIYGGGLAGSLRDMNGDGALDLVGVEGGTTRILQGRGDGTFINTGVSFTGSSTIADLNGDGALDLVVLGASMQVLLGNGNFSFRAPVTLGGFTAPSGIGVGDHNGDGILDVFSTDQIDSTLRVALGNSNGTFQAAISIASITGYTIPTIGAIGDFDGDGRDDVVVNETSDLVSPNLYFANGTSRVLSDGLMTTSRVADLDGNGTLDLFGVNAASMGSAIVTVVMGRGVTESLLNTFDIGTRSGALALLRTIETTHSNLLQSVGKMGAIQSRLGTALSNLETSRENYIGAESRITDIDVAQESAVYVRSQLLQQVGAAILGQATQQPALALRLLQG